MSATCEHDTLVGVYFGDESEELFLVPEYQSIIDERKQQQEEKRHETS